MLVMMCIWLIFFQMLKSSKAGQWKSICKLCKFREKQKLIRNVSYVTWSYLITSKVFVVWCFHNFTYIHTKQTHSVKITNWQTYLQNTSVLPEILAQEGASLKPSCLQSIARVTNGVTQSILPCCGLVTHEFCHNTPLHLICEWLEPSKDTYYSYLSGTFQLNYIMVETTRQKI